MLPASPPAFPPEFPPDARMFFCIGAQKAGTAWIDQLLRQSPDCHFSKTKELHYFDVLGGVADPVYQHRVNLAATFAGRLKPELGPANRPVLLAMQQVTAQLAIHSGPTQGPGRHAAYLDYLLAGRRTEPVICDITPTYALLDSPMFRDMADIGQARFLFILRDPVDRIWAQIRMAVQAQNLPAAACQDACIVHGWNLISSGRLAALAPTDHAMGRADYARTIVALEAAVPADRIKYLFYDQLFTQDSADALCTFLDIAPGLALPLKAGAKPGLQEAEPEAILPATLARALHAALYPQYEFAKSWFGDSLPVQWQEAAARVPVQGLVRTGDLPPKDPVTEQPVTEQPVTGISVTGISVTGDPLQPTPLHPVRARLRFGTLRAVAALILREMSTTYGRSAGGYLWAVLEPVLSITLLTFVFSLAFRSPPLGTNFPIFYATGFMPFILFNDVSNKLSQAIGFSKQLLNYPRITFIDVMVARMVLSVLTKLLVSYLIFLGILSFYDTGTRIDLPHVLLSFAMAAAFGIGVGTMNCFLMSMFPVWRQAWSIVTTPLMLISGVIVMVDTLPDQFLFYLTLNPLVHITAEMRVGFYYSYAAPFISPAYVFAVSLVLTAAGLLFLRRYYRDILE
jgi:capsular polysaccharide transport system permease protein